MKRFFSLGLIATVLAALSFTSCSKDEDSGDIVGKWKLVSLKMEIEGGMSMTFEGEDLAAETVEFKNDGTSVATIVDEDEAEPQVIKSKYVISGDVLTTTDEDGTVEKAKFSVSGNTLVITMEGYYDMANDVMYEKQPSGADYPKVSQKLTFKRM